MILDEICKGRRRDVEVARALRPLQAPPPRAVPHRMYSALAAPGFGLICEIKKASPSKGPIDLALDVAARAREYARGGARAISVLTEPTYFAGSMADLRLAAGAVEVPLLRKDFIVDAYQVLETAHSEASCLLLIVAALDESTFRRLFSLADGLGLDVLVEVHTETELARALDSPARLIGVNNRDLQTLAIDLAVSEKLIPRIPAGRIAVAESGFSRPDEVKRLVECGARAILVGESLMTHGQPAEKMRELLSGPSAS